MIDPRGLDVIEWCNFMTQNLQGRAAPPAVSDEKQWKSWASTVCQAPSIARHNPPSPWLFDDWRQWAELFNLTVPN